VSRFPRLVATCALALAGQCATAALGAPAATAVAQDREYQVKAAYIFNLLPFTTWPATAFRSANAPLNLCVATPNPFGDALRQTFQNEHVGSHPVAIVQVTSPAAVVDCHVLVVGSDADATGALEQVAQNAAVLTIGESPRFEQRGGIITFVIEQGRVRFDLNQTAAARVNLQFSSKVLQVARNIT
jgi:hypothetical protein